MTISFVDVCRFTPTAGGTGDFVVSAAATGYLTPANAGAVNGATYRYRAESADLTQWEVGYGVYASATTTLARTTILKSSNANAKVNFTNPPSVGLVYLAEDAMSSQNNLSDLQSASSARTSLGVTATGADTTYAFRANNLSDLASASSARSNLGLGGAATLNVGTSSSMVAAGDDSRITGAVQKASTGTISVGYTLTPFNKGTVSSGTYTPAASDGNYQYYTNNGAHTVAAPSSDCAIDILCTNGASAGAITFSGFTVGSNTGDTLTTTNTNKFLISLRRINTVSTYVIKALQ
jgi:hypothetical protein